MVDPLVAVAMRPGIDFDQRWCICMRALLVTFLLATAFGAGNLIAADDHVHGHLHHHPEASDTRTLVELPAPMRAHMLANMRIHVTALNEILDALASDQADKAAHVAEWQLGLSSLKAHHADELGKYLPKAMRAIGWKMHSAASRFAIEAQNAGVTDDVKPALAALGKVTAQCAACHAAYRVH
jgi:hypothetical protein